MVTMARYAGNPFRQLSTLHVPGVDRIDEVYEKVAERIVSSVAHLTGRKRVLSETYALIGWKLAPPYMKSIFDHQAARGVNLLSPHGFYYSVEGFRKNECPPSEFFQNPWWPHFRPFADYVRRVCFAMSQGRPQKDFLLYYPIETIYTQISPEWPQAMTAGPTEHWQVGDRWHPAVQTDTEFVKLCVRLEEMGFDYDLVDHSFLDGAKVSGEGGEARLEIGDISVRCVVVPYAATIAASTRETLVRFARAGGLVLPFGCAPETPDGQSLGIEGLPNAPLMLEEELRKSGRLPCRPVLPSTPGEIYRFDLRTPSTHNPKREVRPVANFGHTVTYRELEDGTIVVFCAANMMLTEPMGWGYMTGPRGRTIVLDPVGGDAHAAETGFEPFLAVESLDSVMLGDLHEGSMLAAVVPDPSVVDRLRREPDPVQSGWKAVRHPKSWRLRWEDGEEVTLDELSPWSGLGRPFYSGMGVYRTEFEADHDGQEHSVEATVRETAELLLNGHSCGVRAFGPFEWRDLGQFVRAGTNVLEVRVANTLQGELEGVERLSGLLRLMLYM
jgi:hypothetical protein